MFWNGTHGKNVLASHGRFSMEMDEEEEKKGTEKSNEKESSFMERRIVIVAYTKVGPNQEWRHLVSLEKY